MEQAPPRFAALTPTMIRRAGNALPPTPAIETPPRRLSREDVRFFLHAYVAALIVFLTWLA